MAERHRKFILLYLFAFALRNKVDGYLVISLMFSSSLVPITSIWRTNELILLFCLDHLGLTKFPMIKNL